MGLDQYAYATYSGKGRKSQRVELAYWRKHSDLEGYMADLYEEKTGTSDIFNCKQLYLDADDLDLLAETIVNDSLPHTTGFFFGESDRSQEQIDADLEFINKAHWHLREGFRVYYTSWW